MDSGVEDPYDEFGNYVGTGLDNEEAEARYIEDEVENDYMKVQQKLGGFVFGGWIGGKYEPFLNKLKKMDELWSNNWGIKEWGTDQCMITYLADFENDNFNGIKYGCSWYFCDLKEKRLCPRGETKSFYTTEFHIIGSAKRRAKSTYLPQF